MSRRRWKCDGPIVSAQGYGHSWVIMQTIMRMSRAAAEARAETAVLWHFFHDHPEQVPTRRELDSIPPERFIQHAHEQMRRFASERARRKAVLESSHA